MKKYWEAGILFLFLTLLCLCRPVESEQAAMPLTSSSLAEDLTVQYANAPGGEPLSIDEATRLGVMHNLDILIARTGQKIQDQEPDIAQSIYDTEFTADATYWHNQEQNTSVVLGSRQLTGDVKVGLEKKIPLGTDLKLEAWTERNSTDSAFSNLNRSYKSFAKVSVTQPLLRNFFGKTDRDRIHQVEMDTRKMNYETVDLIEQSVYELRNRYWDLVLADKNLEARAKGLRKAQDFYRITREKLDIGLTEGPDVYAAEANVRERVVDFLEARNEYESASFALKVSLDTMEVQSIKPVSKLDFKPVKINFKQAIEAALENRRDLKALEADLESKGVDLQIARQNLLPELAFEGSYASGGLDRQMASSQGEVFSFHHPQYYAGFSFSSPLERREGRGRKAQAQFDLDRVRQQMKKAKLEIYREVDESVRSVYLAIDRVHQTQKIEALQHSKLSGEEKNFNTGRSNSATIIDFQEDVIDAEMGAIRALVSYFKSIDQFYRSTHRLLAQAGVTEEDAVSPGGNKNIEEGRAL
ncbi:MAG: TolC family protein [Candidatus Omnitrophica bacterium]|nr:TolC family protein [Candidatus Omnitrophota bacterium]